ncbi:MAG: ATP-binding protein, partial [Anaerolineae bacterium]|nr:ATP-binding protein [Anaerolineae bacterium]
ELPRVFCDPTRIRQVVLNLLSNAGRFTERGGVRVRAWAERDRVVVCVADTGPGIPAEARDRVFQPFQQLDSSTRGRYGGSGLGLSISKRFIELHDGKMWLESEEGKGSAFYFSLPIELPPPTARDAMRWFSPYWHYVERDRPSAAPVPTVRPRFVVLDAEQVLTRMLTRYMHSAEVVPAASLQEAIEKLAEAPARALLLNDLYPAATVERLGEAALPDGTPAIVCSLPGTHEAAGALGVSDYLVKPVSREALLAALDRLRLDGRTILIVDDEPEAVQLFRRILLTSARGYRILTASDGEEALQILAAQPADAILLDLVMPGMDGFRFLAEKSRDLGLRDIPVVVMSARDSTRQPIVSTTLAVRQSRGLSLPQLLACIDAVSNILSPQGQAGDPARPGTPSG